MLHVTADAIEQEAMHNLQRSQRRMRKSRSLQSVADIYMNSNYLVTSGLRA